MVHAPTWIITYIPPREYIDTRDYEEQELDSIYKAKYCENSNLNGLFLRGVQAHL